MPVIIDANRASDFSPPHAAHAPEIVRRIAEQRMSVVVGGRLLQELFATKLRGLLLEWIRAGRAKRVRDDSVNTEECKMARRNIVSDDPHILALAQISGCRLIYTTDKSLIIDFKNTKLLSPKGKVVKPDTRTNVALSLFDRLGV